MQMIKGFVTVLAATGLFLAVSLANAGSNCSASKAACASKTTASACGAKTTTTAATEKAADGAAQIVTVGTQAEKAGCAHATAASAKCDPAQCKDKATAAKCDPAQCKDKATAAKCDPAQCKDKSKTTADAAKCNFKNMSTADVNGLLQKGEKVVIFDARSSKFDDGRRLPGAVALTADCKAEDVAKYAPAKDASIITYCAGVKCAASKNLATQLASLGYTNVNVYEEGIEGWEKAGFKFDMQTKTAAN